MKKYLIILLFFIFLSLYVQAEECDTVTDEWCVGQTCLTNLQQNYNLWSTTGNTGKSCIKVIAKRNGNNKTYLSGKNPQTNYLCSNGIDVTSKLISSALSDSETDVNECKNDTCYIPEVWLMDCGTTTSSNDSGNGVVNNNNNVNANNNSNNSNNDVTINENGQITGTTDTSETGVETYFIVLLILVILSYTILLVSKKKNLFKTI